MRLEGLHHASSNRRTVRASERGEEGASGHRSNPCLPDGRWVAYNSLESGRLEVYVAAFPSFWQKRQLSAGGGAQPQWRGDGKELYYLAPDRELMAGDVRSGAILETGVPHGLFQFNAIFNGEVNFFAPAPDGQKFYFGEPSPEDHPESAS